MTSCRLLTKARYFSRCLDSSCDNNQTNSNFLAELTWLGQKEDEEINRDWAEPNLNVQRVEKYYESLMSELERRESQFTSVVDRGEALLVARHPASKLIEAYLSKMQGKWAWLLQLTLCLETHLRYVL